MTATEERTITPRFVALNHLRGVGYGYALGRAAAGDVRVQGNDASDFGDYYAAKHERDLDIDELYAEFVAARTDVVEAEIVPCCDLHKDEGCCDPDDCGPCCQHCPTCPAVKR